MLSAQLQTTVKEPEDKRSEPSPVFGSVRNQIDPNKALEQLSSFRFNERSDTSAGVNERAYQFDATVAAATGGEVNLEMISVMKNSMVEKHATKPATPPDPTTRPFTDQQMKEASALANGQPIAQPSAEAQKTAQALSNASPEAISIAAQGIPLSEAQSIALANAVDNAHTLAQRQFIRGREALQIVSTTESVNETLERLRSFSADQRRRAAEPAAQLVA